MTELYINGYLSVLPASIEFSIVEDNPFLTKSGEYSLELELSLREAANAKIFNHIARFNRKGDQVTLPAILMAGNRVCMRGTAVILGHTDISVKIHLLSGNSELNYFIGADRKIGDLDLGTETTITKDRALDTLDKCFPESNFACAPVIVDSSYLLNDPYPNYGESVDVTPKNITMMPYLLYYVQKIPGALGYTVIENQLLDDEMLCRLYIPHTKAGTLRYNEILAEWTVLDFLSEIEKFCNVVFVIDRETLLVRIIRNYNRDKNSEKIYIDEIIDEYEAQYDSENEIETLDYEQVSYALPSNEYYQYRRLSENVMEKVTLKEYYTYRDLIIDLAPPAANYNKREVYRVKKYILFGFLHIEADNYYVIEDVGSNTHAYHIVHQFRDAGEKNGNTIELKIIPAEMGSSGAMQAPALTAEEKKEENENQGVIDLIEAGDDRDDGGADTIPVAIFVGKIKLNSFDPERNEIVPWSQTDSFVIDKYTERFVYPPEFDEIQWEQISEQERNEYIKKILRYEKFTLRLQGQYGLFETCYSKNKNISSKEIRIIHFIAKQKISPQNLFVINNREFICISLETKFNDRGALPIIEGKFYPVE
ncbi:MAG: hypothetical protein LBI65_01870 [Candidatus Symbiothrix sp.]|jgi:hypothetical protein|nr:hypothetical protein [Candidatus Symbiothrix sp.]